MDNEEVPVNDLPQDDSNLAPVPPEDIPITPARQTAASETPVPEHDLPDEDKYSTAGQQALTALEGAARGASLGTSTGLEQVLSDIGVPGLTNEDILRREHTNPGWAKTSEIGGNIALMAATEGIGELFGAGSKAVDSMIQMGLISGGDEYSKAMLGVGDPLPAVAAHIAGSSILGLLTGGILGKVSTAVESGAEKAAKESFGKYALNYVAGMGQAAKNPMATDLGEAAAEKTLQQLADSGVSSDLFNAGAFKDGQKIVYQSLIPKAEGLIKYGAAGTGSTKGALLGYGLSGYPGAVAGGMIGGKLGEVAGEKLGKAIIPQLSQKIVGPMLLKMAANGNFQGAAKALDYGLTTSKGVQAIGKGVDYLFKAGNAGADDFIDSTFFSDKKRDHFKKYIEDGGVAAQTQDESQQVDQPTEGFAKGGSIKAVPNLNAPNPIATHWPEQNILLSAARGRISNYLNSQRPLPNQSKLPYDSEPKDPQKEREYDKVIDMASQPLSVLKHIKDGSLLPKHMIHFTGMFPELHQELSKKITERMTKAQLNDEPKPPYKTRQALSLFLGTSLDSTLTPAGIQAAQGVFMQQSAQKAAAAKENSLSKIGMNAQTPEQSRTQRLNKS